MQYSQLFAVHLELLAKWCVAESLSHCIRVAVTRGDVKGVNPFAWG